VQLVRDLAVALGENLDELARGPGCQQCSGGWTRDSLGVVGGKERVRGTLATGTASTTDTVDVVLAVLDDQLCFHQETRFRYTHVGEVVVDDVYLV
jgi:hypothetical protein